MIPFSVVITIFFTVLAQIIFKLGAHLIVFPKQYTFQTFFVFLINVFLNPYVIGSGLCTLGAMFSWLIALKRFPLSSIYPFMSLSYVIVMIIAGLFFKETLSLSVIVGSLFILIGNFIVGCC